MTMTRATRVGLERAPGSFGAGYVAPRPSADILAERDARMSYVETPNQAVLGDPPPGRSAFDGYVHRGDYSGKCREKW